MTEIGNSRRKRVENLFDFLFFLKLKPAQFVVGFNYRKRFNEQSGTGCRGVMDKSLYLPLVLRFYRYNVSALTYRYKVVL